MSPYDKVDKGLEKLLARLLPSEYLREVMSEHFGGDLSFWAISCKDMVVQQVVGLILEGTNAKDLEGLQVDEALKIFEDSVRVKSLVREIKKCAETGIPVERLDDFGDFNIKTKIMRVGENGHSMCILSSERVNQ